MSANKPKTTGEGSGTGDGKMADENMELDERKVKILDAVIRNYLATGEPVGSRTISKYTDLNLSSATIRNEMADLEELGYIVQPHTSAGRIPSDKGYRFYVDHLMQERHLLMMERRVTQSVFPSLQSMVLLIIAVRDF